GRYRTAAACAARSDPPRDRRTPAPAPDRQNRPTGSAVHARCRWQNSAPWPERRADTGRWPVGRRHSTHRESVTGETAWDIQARAWAASTGSGIGIMPDSAAAEKRARLGDGGGTLLLVQTRIELIHHGRPLRIPLELLAQEGRLSRRPEGSIHQLHVLGQSVGGEEALDFLVVRGQPELVEQGGQVLIG